MDSYANVLESYTISDNPHLITVEAFIYGAFESDISSAKELKSKLNVLAKAKSDGDSDEIRQAKEDVDASIAEVTKGAESEKDANRKAKLKKIAKIGGIIASTIVAAATIGTAAKRFSDKVKDRRAKSDEIARRIDENNAILRRQREELEASINALCNAKSSYFDTHSKLPKL